MYRHITDVNVFLEDDVSAVESCLVKTKKTADVKIRLFTEDGDDLEHGAHSLLCWAAFYNAKNIARYLVEAGASMYDDRFKGAVNPLHFACRDADAEMVRLLADHALKTYPAALGEKTWRRQYTPLHYAVFEGNVEVVKLMADLPFTLELDVLEDIAYAAADREKDFPGICAPIEKMRHKANLIQMVERWNPFSVFKEQFEKCPVSLDYFQQGSPSLLNKVFCLDDLSVRHRFLEYILAKGADPNFTKTGEDPASYYAIDNHDPVALAMLLKSGANPEAQCESGQSLIEFARLVAVQEKTPEAQRNVDTLQEILDKLFMQRCLQQIYMPERPLSLPKMKR